MTSLSLFSVSRSNVYRRPLRFGFFLLLIPPWDQACEMCDYRTYSSFNLKLHLSKMHNAPSLQAVCPVCQVGERILQFLRKSTKLNLKPVFGSGEVGIRIDLALLDPDWVAIKLIKIIPYIFIVLWWRAICSYCVSRLGRHVTYYTSPHVYICRYSP
jgi:hypothetical protein